VNGGLGIVVFCAVSVLQTSLLNNMGLNKWNDILLVNFINRFIGFGG
jgi:hypothetical protein